MTLRELITQKNLTGTASEIAAVLNAKTEPVANSELYTSTGVILELGPDLARQALAGFLAAAQNDPLLQSQYDKLNSTGIDFSHPLTQQMIDQLQMAGAFSAEVAAALKGIGIRYKSPYELAFGDGAVVTPEQIEQALQPPTVTGKRYILSCIVGPGQQIANLVVSELSGPEIVSTKTYGMVNGVSSGDPAVDGLLTRILSELSSFANR